MHEEQYFLSMNRLLEFPLFSKLNLIAGENGLDNEVSSCGILDYQLAPEMKTRYQNTAFVRGMLVLTSFMYVVDKEYLISDAVRKLDACGVAGLVVCNAFRIRIPDSVIRFANVSKFPILIYDDSYGKSLGTLISSLYNIIDMYSNTGIRERLVNKLLNQDLDEQCQLELTYQIYPSIGSNYMIAYLNPLSSVGEREWFAVEKLIRSHPRPYMDCSRYNGGLLIFREVDPNNWDAMRIMEDDFSKKLFRLLPKCSVGTSFIHHELRFFRMGIEEAMQAALLSNNEGVLRYAHLGIYRILANAANDYRMKEFSNDVLRPIFDYDASENGKLANTLFGLVECNRNLHALSIKLGQHENTIRQRLSRIEHLNGLDYRNGNDYEQLSIAVKIHHVIGRDYKLPIN